MKTKLDDEIRTLENEIFLDEQKNFSPKDFYRKLDRLDTLKAQRKQLGEDYE